MRTVYYLPNLSNLFPVLTQESIDKFCLGLDEEKNKISWILNLTKEDLERMIANPNIELNEGEYT